MVFVNQKLALLLVVTFNWTSSTVENLALSKFYFIFYFFNHTSPVAHGSACTPVTQSWL